MAKPWWNPGIKRRTPWIIAPLGQYDNNKDMVSGTNAVFALRSGSILWPKSLVGTLDLKNDSVVMGADRLSIQVLQLVFEDLHFRSLKMIGRGIRSQRFERVRDIASLGSDGLEGLHFVQGRAIRAAARMNSSR